MKAWKLMTKGLTRNDTSLPCGVRLICELMLKGYRKRNYSFSRRIIILKPSKTTSIDSSYVNAIFYKKKVQLTLPSLIVTFGLLMDNLTTSLCEDYCTFLLTLASRVYSLSAAILRYLTSISFKWKS